MEYNFNLIPPNNSSNSVGNVASVRLMMDNANPAILPALAQNGAVLNGVVQGRNSSGVVSLKTEFGNINIKSDLFLKRGTELAIKIEQKQSELIAKIISINGLSPAKYQEITQGEQASAMQDKVTTSSNVIAKQVSDAELKAQNINQPAISSINNNATPNLSAPQLRAVFLQQPIITPELLQQINPSLNAGNIGAGTALQLKIISILIPDEILPNQMANDDFATLNNIATNAAVKLTNNAQSNAAKQSTANIMAENASGQKALIIAQLPKSLPTQAISATPPNNSTPNNSTPTNSTLNYLKNMLPNVATINAKTLNPIMFNGVVMQTSNAQTNMRELTMQTDMGMVKLFLSTPLPKGSIIQFELLALEQVRGGATLKGGASIRNEVALQDLSPEELLKTTLLQTKAIPATLPEMQEIIELKHLSAIPTPPQLQPHIVPRLGSSLAGEMMFFLTALAGFQQVGNQQGANIKQSGNDGKISVKNWIGDALHQQLSSTNEGSNQLNKLSNEFSSLKQSLGNLDNGEWQSALIPLYDGTQVRPIQLFMKKKQSTDKGESQLTNHFMLELELNNIGLMQLDGLVQQQKPVAATRFAQTQFNMIIRTQQPWQDEMKAEIMAIFINAQAITGAVGTIQFQHGNAAIVAHPTVDNTHSNINDSSIMA